MLCDWGIVLLGLVLVVVIAVLVLLRVVVMLFLLSLGQSLRVRKLMCVMQMRLARVTYSEVHVAMA